MVQYPRASTSLGLERIVKGTRERELHGENHMTGAVAS